MRDFIPVEAKPDMHLVEAGFWLDPGRSREWAFVSHAHSDHFARHQHILCSPLTAKLITRRFAAKSELVIKDWGEPWERQGYRYVLWPAGHAPGSAFLHATRLADGASLLYTGDFKLRDEARASEQAHPVRADTLIMETTFGRPCYVFPPVKQIRDRIHRFCLACLEEGEVPILVAYALGKTQEVLTQLYGTGLRFALHQSAVEMTRICQEHSGQYPEWEEYDPANREGRVLVMPPSATRSQAIRRIRKKRLALCSGWAQTSGATFRYQVDEAFPLSDHADYPELWRLVEAVDPRLVYTVHGFREDFARDLRAAGRDAWPLGGDTQAEFDFPVQRAAKVALEWEEDRSGIVVSGGNWGRWVQVCEAVAKALPRKEKVNLVAQCFAGLQAERTELAVAARFFAGVPVSQRELRGKIKMGPAMIRAALLQATGLRLEEYRSISETQGDMGRTVLLCKTQSKFNEEPGALGLEDVQREFESWATKTGGMGTVVHLAALFRKATPHEARYVAGLLGGDLRFGLREGMVEDAMAEAFGEDPVAIREAHMLTGDLGATILLAADGRCREAGVSPFVPLRPMLASPQPDSEAVWQNMAKDGRVWLEPKFDGVRAQLHRQGNRAALFSRDSRDLSAEFPEVLAMALRLEDDVILDGEIVMEQAGGNHDFSALQKRLGRSSVDLFMGLEGRVCFHAFDLLWKNGQTFFRESLERRRSELDRLVMPDGMALVPVSFAKGINEIEATFQAARRAGWEGLMAKDAASSYQAGRRGGSWVKLKKDFSTLDVVVVEVKQGHGKRSHLLSDYTFAVRDGTGSLRVIGKAYSGLTDQEIEELGEVFRQHVVETRRKSLVVEPTVVIEVAFDSLRASDRHDSGLAMRFPRIKCIRRDKSVEEIDTLATARLLAGLTAGEES